MQGNFVEVEKILVVAKPKDTCRLERQILGICVTGKVMTIFCFQRSTPHEEEFG